jgi:peptidyl-prolyl cis-trans isomerase D
MFDLVRNNKKIIQIVLALIMVPFALWGVDSYVRTGRGGANDVAMVGGTPIGLQEFQQSLREQQERVRAQLGARADQELLDSAELRQQVLQDLINQRLLAVYAHEAKLRVSDETLAAFITSVPSLQENGKFSRERYQSLVAAQGMSIEMFEARVKQDMLIQQAMMAAGNAAVTGKIPTERWLAAQFEERVVSEAILRAEQFAGDSKPEAAAVKRYYEENRAKFEKPEQVRVAYITLSQDKFVGDTRIDDAAVKAFYQSNEAKFKQPEQRRASHVLIRVDKQAPAAEVKAAQEKAEQVLAQLKAPGADFGKIARQNSQDPGSAEKGGDLGFFGRGMMVKPFEDAVFGLTENQLSGLVRSDFGFHLIRLTGVRAERARPLEEVRNEIIAEIKRETATKRYAEAVEGFGNMVYEQSDSLQPVAEKYGLAIKESDWLAQGGKAMAPFDHPKLIKALFTDDAIKNKRNTEAIDVGGNMLVAARVIDHRPAASEPLEAVSGIIEKLLAREVALTKVATSGKDKLVQLQKGEKADLAWSPARPISRIQASQIPVEARRAIFGTAANSLPAYAGLSVPVGYVIYRIEQVKPYEGSAAGEAARIEQALRQQYGQIVAQEEVSAWMAALRQRYPVTINSAVLERK